MSRNLPNEITALDSRVTVVENTGGSGGSGLLTFASYAAAKAANYSAVADGAVIYIKGRTATASGGGVFEVDKSDTTTADNDGTVLVATGGVRLKRFIEDDWIHVNWFADDDRSQAQNWNTALQTVDDVAFALNKGVWVDSPQTPGHTWLHTVTLTWRCGRWDSTKTAFSDNGILHGMLRFTPSSPTADQAAIELDPPNFGWTFSVSLQGPNAFKVDNYSTWVVSPADVDDYNTGFAAGQCGLKLITQGHGVIEKCSFGNFKVGVWIGVNGLTSANHVYWRDCKFETGFGVYFFNENQDYRFENCEFVECGWAGILMNQRGTLETTFYSCHFGFTMSGIYQLNDTNLTLPATDIFGLNLFDCKFEQISECAIWLQPGKGVRGLRIFGGYVGGNDGWGFLPPSSWYGTGPGTIFETRHQFDIRLGEVRDDVYFNGFQNPIGEGLAVCRVLINQMWLATAKIFRTRPSQIDISFASGDPASWLLAQHFQDYGQRQPVLSPGNILGNPEDLTRWTNPSGTSLSIVKDPYSITTNILDEAQAVGGPIPGSNVLAFNVTSAAPKTWDLTLSGSIPAGSYLSFECFAYATPSTIGIKPEIQAGGTFKAFRGQYNLYASEDGWTRLVCTGVYTGGNLGVFRLLIDTVGTVYVANMRVVVGPPAGYSRSNKPSISTPFGLPAYTSAELPAASEFTNAEVVISDAVRADSGLGVKAISLKTATGGWAWYNAADYSRILKTAAQYLSQLTGTYSTAEQNAITAFYSAISSLLPKMVAIYLGRVKNSGDSLINLVSSDHTATLESGGPGFTADAGWGTGAGLFNTNFNPITHGRWTSTSATFGAYYESVGTGRALNGIAQDASSGGQRVYLSPDPSGNTEYALNSPSDSVYAGFAAGLWSVRRSGAAIELYQGATAVDTESNTASSLLNDTLTMTGHGTGYRISMLYIAEGLTAGEISTLNSAYNTLRATL